MIVSMLSVVVISGGVAMAIGAHLLWRQMNQEAENRVRGELSAAREFYRQRLAAIDSALRYTALGEKFSQAAADRDTPSLAQRLRTVRATAGLDLLSVTDAAGRVIYRAHRPDRSGDARLDDPLVQRVVATGEAVSGTILVPVDRLEREDPALARRARIRVVETPKARPTDLAELDAGMMLCAAAPVRGPDGRLAGVLRAAVLLNRNFALVDQVENTVFRNELYRGRPLGTVTIFQGDVRISTNVQRADGTRAIGTRVSAEVYEHVLPRGKTWLGPAWVVNQWYVSAYEPIYDMDQQPIGMLYVGLLKDKFSDVTRRTLALFGLITLAGVLAAGAAGWKLANSMSRPLSSLASASAAIARGELSQELPVQSSDEIGSLTRAFNTMARSLKERDELLKQRTRLELSRSERLAAIGRLAAGVAHEINNPLTGVLTFAHLLLKDAPDGSRTREDLETIIEATTRCRDIVRGLLDFSRQNEPHTRPSDLNSVLREALALTQNQAHINHVSVAEELDPDLPDVVIDANQIQQVAVNVIVNAIDAMPDGGRLTVRTRRVRDGAERVAFEIADTGSGIREEDLEHVFDPFFTTKPVGMGTGLGLAIAYGVVAEHGGRIELSSEIGRGTTVIVRLPAAPEEEPREEERSGLGGG